MPAPQTDRDEAATASPFLRWKGSKRVHSAFIAALIPAEINRYFEPFLGSAAVFLAARPARAILSDALHPLIHTYETVRRHPAEVARAASTFDRASYYDIRSQDPTILNPIQRTARFLFLNAHCFNGLYRTNRTNNFNVPLGSRAGALPDEHALKQVAAALENTQLSCVDARTQLASVRRGDFVYLDPPFPGVRPSYGEYGYHDFGTEAWDWLINDELARLSSIGATFALSLPAGLSAPSRYRVVRLDCRYTIGGTARTRRVSEQLLLNHQ